MSAHKQARLTWSASVMAQTNSLSLSRPQDNTCHTHTHQHYFTILIGRLCCSTQRFDQNSLVSSIPYSDRASNHAGWATSDHHGPSLKGPKWFPEAAPVPSPTHLWTLETQRYGQNINGSFPVMLMWQTGTHEQAQNMKPKHGCITPVLQSCAAQQPLALCCVHEPICSA